MAHTGYRTGLAGGASLLVLALAQGAPALAQQQETVLVEEILVTANKRAESVQKVPIAITAFDQKKLEKLKLDDVKSVVDFTPGFAGKSKDSFLDTISIRGISTNSYGVGNEPSVGVFKDGIYQGRNGSAITSFYDMERVEALRGPQGFLFGRNAISGAISLITAKPELGATYGAAHLDVGERGRIAYDGSLNVAAGDKLAFRLAGYHSEENGSIENDALPDAPKALHHNKTALRGGMTYENGAFRMVTQAEYENRKQSGSIYKAFPESDRLLNTLDDLFGGGGAPDRTKFHIGQDRPDDRDNGKIFAITNRIDLDLDTVTLSSLSGYKQHSYHYAEDFDGSPYLISNYQQDQHGTYFEQEFRAVSNTDGPLSWYAGVSGYQEKLHAKFHPADIAEDVVCAIYYGTDCQTMYEDYYGTGAEYPYTASGMISDRNRTDSNYKGWGSYLDVTYAFTDQWDASVGLRYAHDSKEFTNEIYDKSSKTASWFGSWNFFNADRDDLSHPTGVPVTDKKSWNSFTPRFILRYKPSDQMMVYASAARGFKAGGFSTFNFRYHRGSDSLSLQSFHPEKLWSYELGMKGTYLDGRLQTALTSYYYQYKDLQFIWFNSEIRSTVESNFGKVKGYGLEGSVSLTPVDNLEIDTAFTLNRTKTYDVPSDACGGTTSADCDGKRLSMNPKASLSAGATWHIPTSLGGEAYLSGQVRWQSRMYGPGNFLNERRYSIAPYADAGFRAGFESEKGWEIALYMENAFNKQYWDGIAPSSISSDGYENLPAHRFGPSHPRTIGVDLRVKLGK